jgi:acetyl-CoA carboxylase biotin carboxyl carrier protein
VEKKEAPMALEVRTATAGNMWKVLVKVGDKVKAGDTLFIMEVMKMEVPHEAPIDGIVRAVHVKEDQEGLDAEVPCIEIE